MKNYTIGYDIGITSIGWAVMDEDNKLVDMGVRKFKEATPASDARLKRSQRVTLRRKKWRLNQLRRVFAEYDLESLEKLEDEEYRKFHGMVENQKNKYGTIPEKTVYHLRKRGLTKELSTRELFICMHNIAKTRGHFYMDTIDFEKGSIKYELFEQKFFELTSEKVTVIDKETLSNNHLKKIFNSDKEYKRPTFKMFESICATEEENKIIFELIKFLKGYKVSNEIIGEKYEKASMNINEYKTQDVNSDFINELITLYDMVEITKFLKSHTYLCEKLVDQLEQFDAVSGDNNSAEFKIVKDLYKNIQKAKKDKVGVVKNIGNNYPNGLYLKEARAILENQKQYNSKITDEFIELCLEIISAHIPYWMGKLSDSEETKNSWIVRKDGKVKYSYKWTSENLDLFNESASQEAWKKNMISRCTYLPDEYALPKQSFLNELYIILNELNVLSCNDNEYKLKMQDKVKVINELFLQKPGSISFEEIRQVLNLESFGFKKTSNSRRKNMNKVFSLYHNIVAVKPELKIDDIAYEIDQLQNENENSKINEIEDIILTLNLFDDKKNKKEKLQQTCTEEQAEILSKLNTKDFANFSEKLLIKTPLNDKRQPMIDILLGDNPEGNQTNEQMTILTNAVDENGEKLNLVANKYAHKFKAGAKLNQDLLLERQKGNKIKNLVPMSRPVIRSINELFKVHNDLEKYFGIPAKIVVETARDLKDPKKGETAKHYDNMKKLHEDVLKQVDNKQLQHLEPDFENINEYLLKNKKKIELYLRQLGEDIITGSKIELNNLDAYQIDHILPRGFGDNSMDNLILIDGKVNNVKDNRTPLEYLRDTGSTGEPAYRARVAKLYELKMISENKYNRLMLEDTETAIGFVQRNLVDTRYIIKEFTSILEAYYKYGVTDKTTKTDIVSLQGTFNGIFRSAFKFPKSRNVGEQHHAHDAAIIITVDKCLNALYPNYNKSASYSKSNYDNFLKNLTRDENTMKMSNAGKAINMIRAMYFKAFDQDYDHRDSFITNVKNTTPLLFWKEERNYKGEFFNQTIYPQKDYKDTAVLSILGVNNSKAVYSDINSYCVDFYKLTINKGTKKEKKKHFAVHVPKVIIDKDGNINKEQYMKLITDHYGYHELLDEYDQLMTGAFRMRVLRNEMIFDTERNELMLFNIGSIVNKKLEILNPNITNFTEIERLTSELYAELDLDYKELRHGINSNKHLHPTLKFLLTNLNPNHKLIKEIDDIDIALSVISNGEIADRDKKIYSNLINISEKIKKDMDNPQVNFREILEYVADLIVKSQNSFSPPPIIGRILPTADNLTEEDAYYQKVIISPLGVRWEKVNGKLKISGVKGIDNRKNYKVVKKDEFSWQV